MVLWESVIKTALCSWHPWDCFLPLTFILFACLTLFSNINNEFYDYSSLESCSIAAEHSLWPTAGRNSSKEYEVNLLSRCSQKIAEVFTTCLMAFGGKCPSQINNVTYSSKLVPLLHFSKNNSGIFFSNVCYLTMAIALAWPTTETPNLSCLLDIDRLNCETSQFILHTPLYKIIYLVFVFLCSIKGTSPQFRSTTLMLWLIN